MKRLRDYFLLDVSIQNKLLLSGVFLVLVSAAITVGVFYTRFYRETADQTLTRQSALVQQVGLALEEQIRSVEQISNAICTERTLRNILASETPPSWDQLAAMNAVIGSYETRRDIFAVRIFCDTSGPYFLPLSELNNMYWKERMDTSGASRAVFPDPRASGREGEAGARGEESTAALVQIMTYLKSDGWHDACVVVFFSQDRIADLIRRPMELEGEIAYILDAGDQIVADSRGAVSDGGWLNNRALDELVSDRESYARISEGGTDSYVFCADIAGTDWRLVWQIPARSIRRQSHRLLYESIGTYLALLLLAFGVSVLMARSISRRIRVLRERMDAARGEEPVMLEGRLGRDEIGSVMASYNEMLDRLDTLMRQRLDMVEQLNNTEILILRAQIDPHFLYNTLEMIQWMIRNGRPDEAQQAIAELSVYYRRSLNNGRIQCLVADELEHVTMYVSIINRRFDGKIDFLADLPDEMMDCEMPVCVFQPIVENSITHGIFEKPSQEGSIQLMGWMDEEYLYFQISDDGVGMSDEQLQALRHKNESPERSGLGVYNTNERLKMIYGREDIGIDFHSEEGVGTDVTIRIPKQRRNGPRQGI